MTRFVRINADIANTDAADVSDYPCKSANSVLFAFRPLSDFSTRMTRFVRINADISNTDAADVSDYP